MKGLFRLHPRISTSDNWIPQFPHQLTCMVFCLHSPAPGVYQSGRPLIWGFRFLPGIGYDLVPMSRLTNDRIGNCLEVSCLCVTQYAGRSASSNNCPASHARTKHMHRNRGDISFRLPSVVFVFQCQLTPRTRAGFRGQAADLVASCLRERWISG